MQTWVTLSGGTKWAFRLDGLITRAGMYIHYHPYIVLMRLLFLIPRSHDRW